jgi:chromosome segregation ATPase
VRLPSDEESMPSAVADTQLLALLQRAADELKVAQRDGNEARAERDSLRLKLDAAEAELARARPPLESLPGTSAGGESARTVLPQEDATRVSGPELGLLQGRLQAVEEELAQESSATQALRDRLAAAEAGAATERDTFRGRVRELESLLTSARAELERAGAEAAQLERRLAAAVAIGAAERARVEELQAALARLRSGDGAEEPRHDQHADLVAQLATARARLGALEGTQAASDGSGPGDSQRVAVSARLAQLEQDLAGLRSRRDELNVELGHVEKERNTLRARVGELEHARNEVASQLRQAQAQHQDVAAQLTQAQEQAQAQQAELERTLARVAEAERALDGAGRQLQQALAVAEARSTAALAAQEQRLGTLAKELEHARDEWHHVERQYEQLHKEMLLMLDQRDEARRALAAATGAPRR